MVVVLIAFGIVAAILPFAYILGQYEKNRSRPLAEARRKRQIQANLERMKNDPDREERIWAERKRTAWADSRSDFERQKDWSEMGMSTGVWRVK